jgi:hypothetical protein
MYQGADWKSGKHLPEDQREERIAIARYPQYPGG